MGFCGAVVPSHGSYYPLVIILVYFAAVAISWLHHVLYVRLNTKVYGTSLFSAHLAFCIIGTFAYLVVSSALWLRAARYTNNASQRARYVICGMFVAFFLKDLPLCVIEYVLFVRTKRRNILQEICFFVQVSFFLFMLLVLWLSFTWVVTTFLERSCGTNYMDTDSQLNAAGAESQLVPPVMLQETLHGRQKDPGFFLQVARDSPQVCAFSNRSSCWDHEVQGISSRRVI